MAGYPHPRNLIREYLDLTATREIYMPRKFLGIRYNKHTNIPSPISFYFTGSYDTPFYPHISMFGMEQYRKFVPTEYVPTR